MKNDWLSSTSSIQVGDIFEYQFLTNQETNVSIKETFWKGDRIFKEKYTRILRKNKEKSEGNKRTQQTKSHSLKHQTEI